MIITESILIIVGYHFLSFKKYIKGKARATMISWPHSIPRLKERSDDINLSCGILISCNSHANPSPWNNPKKNMAAILDLFVQRNSFPFRNTEVNATYAIERAIIGSTIRELKTKIPVPASIKVILWASVKTAVSFSISRQDTNTRSMESTKSI